MSEFNTNALSVVDKFFGDDSDLPPPAKEATTAERPLSRKEHRGGVGVAKPASHKNSNDLDLQKRILQVGKKRSLEHQVDNDLDSDADDDSQGEEDIGRTSIAEPRDKKQKSATIHAEPIVLSQRQKKKKNQMKTGGSDSHAAVAPRVDGGRTDKDQPTGDAIDFVIDREGIARGSAVADESNNGDGGEPKQNMKRKRRKVRSRQKNIYKDKRENKPEHLIPGSKNYKGKPITRETKQKLGLSED